MGDSESYQRWLPHLRKFHLKKSSARHNMHTENRRPMYKIKLMSFSSTKKKTVATLPSLISLATFFTYEITVIEKEAKWDGFRLKHDLYGPRGKGRQSSRLSLS